MSLFGTQAHQVGFRGTIACFHFDQARFFRMNLDLGRFSLRGLAVFTGGFFAAAFLSAGVNRLEVLYVALSSARFLAFGVVSFLALGALGFFGLGTLAAPLLRS